MTPHQEKLIADYKRASGQRERAELEQMIWDLATADERNEYHRVRGAYLKAALGEAEHKIDDRSAIRNVGPEAATPLWDRVEGDMTLRTARDIVTLARKSQTRSESMKDAIERELLAYNQRPIKRKTRGGKVIRALGAATPSKEPDRPKGRATPPPAVNLESRDFWGQIRQLIRIEVESRLAGYGEMTVREEAQRLESDLKVVFAEFSNRMGQIRHKTPFGVAVTKGRFVEALRALHLDAPAQQEILDGSFERSAKTRYRKLARQYHPDTSGTNETEGRFQAVIEAWRAVQEYCTQVRAGAPR